MSLILDDVAEEEEGCPQSYFATPEGRGLHVADAASWFVLEGAGRRHLVEQTW